MAEYKETTTMALIGDSNIRRMREAVIPEDIKLIEKIIEPTFTQLHDRQRTKDILKLDPRPQIAIINLGGNDIDTKDQTNKHYREIIHAAITTIKTLMDGGILTYIIEILPRTIPSKAKLEDYNTNRIMINLQLEQTIYNMLGYNPIIIGDYNKDYPKLLTDGIHLNDTDYLQFMTVIHDTIDDPITKFNIRQMTEHRDLEKQIHRRTPEIVGDKIRYIQFLGRHGMGRGKVVEETIERKERTVGRTGHGVGRGGWRGGRIISGERGEKGEKEQDNREILERAEEKITLAKGLINRIETEGMGECTGKERESVQKQLERARNVIRRIEAVRLRETQDKDNAGRGARVRGEI